jgi:hypothetical protein
VGIFWRRVWTDLCDRIASFSTYFYSTEHSAQISVPTLNQREKRFKEGKINLLSCSTTMEMGVDASKDKKLKDGIVYVTKRTVLAGISIENHLQKTLEMINKIIKRWEMEYKALSVSYALNCIEVVFTTGQRYHF